MRVFFTPEHRATRSAALKKSRSNFLHSLVYHSISSAAMDENVRNRVTPHTQMYMCVYIYIHIYIYICAYVHYAYANRIPSISHKREAPQRSRLFQARHRGEILRGSAAGCSSEEHKGGDL